MLSVDTLPRRVAWSMQVREVPTRAKKENTFSDKRKKENQKKKQADKLYGIWTSVILCSVFVVFSIIIHSYSYYLNMISPVKLLFSHLITLLFHIYYAWPLHFWHPRMKAATLGSNLSWLGST